MFVIKIAVLGIAGMILSVMLKNTRAEYAVFIGLGTTILIFFHILARMNLIVNELNEFIEVMGIEQKYLGVLVKMIGITYVMEIASGICKDGGCTSIAAQIEMFGRLSIMGIGMSVIVTLVDSIVRQL